MGSGGTSGTRPVDVLFSFDTTGSMYPCLAQVRTQVEETVARLFSILPDLRVGIITHGDYCDGPQCITMQDFSDNQKQISDFVRKAPATYGGDAPECYELALHNARSLNWGAGRTRIMVLIGDDVPHGPNYPQNTKNLDWRNEIGVLLEMGVNIYGVQALRRSHATGFYQEIAKATGGFHLTLDQFSAVTDMILAIAYQQAGPEQIARFEQEVQDSGRYSNSVGAIFDTLLGRPVREVVKTTYDYRAPTRPGTASVKATAAGDVSKLVPVHPARFQALTLSSDRTINDFVREQGLTFKTGRGFYQFTKQVVVQPYKEVVLMENSSGLMFTGPEARKMLGLPEGATVKLNPGDLPGFTAFIQSTSANRKLLAKTKFLYEVDDSPSA